jgi:hypothetical protein
MIYLTSIEKPVSKASFFVSQLRPNLDLRSVVEWQTFSFPDQAEDIFIRKNGRHSPSPLSLPLQVVKYSPTCLLFSPFSPIF